ncbi:EthD domain-containing protein [Blastococcus sp. PRF04-17]|uniref:EthD domain-containing protein n=1 Tax=Blastococcus sp. PRF04-17 TaxID=2933797 RepID=UPI001FF2DE6D|nr:EthD domain-containing protein [Blastococcus sp. PRF04-17]UOY01817.1 EthD domain-containing protein [Blastococcus sp. PRF04-17]
MAPRAAGLTTPAFVEHWRTTHSVAAGRIPGLRRYTQFHPVLVDGRLPLPYPGFDACSLLQFDSLETMDAGFSSDVYRDEVMPNEAVLVDKSRFSLFLGDARISSGIPGGTVVLVTLLRRHPALSAEEFSAALDGPWSAWSGGHEQYVSVGTGRGGRQTDVADAVDVRAFDDPGQALTWLTDEEQGVATDVAMAGLGLVVGRVLARTFQVV